MFFPQGFWGFMLWMVAGLSVASAQTPWQAAPATNQLTSPATTSSTNKLPLFIPLIPNDQKSYQAIDLPPPSNSASSQTIAASGSFVPLQTQSSSSAAHSFPLPDAARIRPRTATGGQVTFPAPGSQDTMSDLPPIPDLQSLQTAGSSVGSFPDAIGPTLNSNGLPNSLVSFQSQSAELPVALTTSFRASQLIAIVGNERVLAGDLAALVEPVIYENRARIANKIQEEEVRQTLIRQALPQYVELKALSQEFFRDMAGNVPPSELKKMREQVTVRASRAFYDRFVPMDLFKQYKVEDLTELDEKLREKGLSLAILKNHFLVQVLAAQLEEKYIAQSYEIPPQEILDYYHQHIEKWQIPARARWRQLTVRFDRHASRSEAENLIGQMGNEVVLGGKPFEAVARHSSEGFTAPDGGVHGWTFEGSLKSQVLNEALFNIPIGRLSNIIEDDIGFHIIEVLEREMARTQDMAEIQSEIRKTLSKQMRQKKIEEFREGVLKRVIVWTRWPEDIPGSRPLEEALGEIDTP